MRNWLNAARSYMRPIEIGEPMRAAGIGRVVASKSKIFVPGDLVRYFQPFPSAPRISGSGAVEVD
jgi:NADPH-dependent curcumin reductase CurA